ncbi:GNAT family N-acetyltransferase [Sporolactobacillus putidus]|uniref:N-acetyltransferase n=1 Tax=Sporolactobacillus putidus TaxID=492735 RepID=A0A917S0G7_9BACL|nr:GNAT family N-acetyltransferase [Sporolactobacillus putidus]GGL49970.1 N-acetyltransferase [Sporolactobacillus putidus]
MIRKLTERDRTLVVDFAGDRPAENLFILGDIETFGFESETVTVWGDFNEAGALISILLRYRDNFIPYAKSAGHLNGQAWAEVIRSNGKLRMLSGLKVIVEQILPFIELPVQDRKLCYYAKREDRQPLNKETMRKDVKMLFPEEADKIVQLRSSIPEFSDLKVSLAEFQENMEKGISRTYYIERNEEPVSAVSTTAETRHAAMIIGVCTKPGYERRGYATSCLIKTIVALKAEHKEPCLFYDNPEAGKIYKKLGFEDIDQWVMASYRKIS